MSHKSTYITVTDEAGKRFFSKAHSGPIVMLNLLKFRATADYASTPDLASNEEISGVKAYQIYMKAVSPLLSKKGGQVLFSGKASQFLIGPQDEKWDAILLVKHRSVQDFMTFANDEAYKAIAGHRTAALEDSRLLPIEEGRF